MRWGSRIKLVALLAGRVGTEVESMPGSSGNGQPVAASSGRKRMSSAGASLGDDDNPQEQSR